eukprot:301504_1
MSVLSNVLGAGTFTAAAGLGVYLGNWQLDRKIWKEELIESHNIGLSAPPTVFPESYTDDDIADLINKRVQIEGTFDVKNQVYVGLRAPPSQVYDEPLGYYLITPLVRKDGSMVLVDRGWVPYQKTDELALNAPAFEDGSALVVGFVRKGETQSRLLPKDKDKLFWTHANMDRAKELFKRPHPPVVIRGTEISPDISNEQGYPLLRNPDGMFKHTTTPMTHLSYAFTWYGCTAAALGMGYFRFVKPLLKHFRKKK